MPLSDNLILELVKLGFIGLAALIFVMMFILLLRNQETTPANNQLRKRFLTLGVAVIAIAALVQVLQMFVGGRPAEVVFSFSPDFVTADLPTPTLQMGAETLTTNTKYPIVGEKMVVIGVDQALKKVRELNATAANLTGAVGDLTRDLTLPPANRRWTVERATDLSRYTKELQGSLQVNDFAKARELNDRIAAMRPGQ